MLRKISLFAVIFAAAFAFPGVASAGVVTPVSILDMFRGTSIDSNVWAFWGTGQPDAVQFYQADGAMNINVAATAPNDFNVGSETRCKASGNFDARVSFKLVNWPAENGVFVSLMISGSSFNVFRVSWQFPDHEQYGAYLPPADSIPVSATGNEGTLRLSREGATFTAYYLDGDTWVPLASGAGTTDDTNFTLAVFNLSAASPFAGLPVTVAFDNFRVHADRIVCP